MENSEKVAQPKNFNKAAYVVFVLAGLSFLFFGTDKSNAVIFIALALVFDPFDITMKWGDRPVWQRVWLIAHLALTFVAIGWTIAN